MKIFSKLSLSLFLFTAIPSFAQEFKFSPDRKLSYAEQIIENYYLDDVDADQLVQEAIVAMMKTLDPHSAYTDPEETKEMTQPLDGNFSGIGIQFNMLNDTLRVIQTIAGGPSEKVGILAGDKILYANGDTISGAKRPNSAIMKILRGPKGSKVDLVVERRGIPEPIEFTVIRDDIPIYSVDAAFMADKHTGYVKISRFAETTDKEFEDALKKLRAQGMTDLIIDLQDNGGGYLGSAVNIASHFLNKGDLVTYTESPKMGRQPYHLDTNGNFANGKLIILTNEYSASASEILSGAIQDHDRGLIVGRRTFGKGLVQRPFPFPDGSMIKLTVSRYYTPSGRSIQKPYKLGDSESYGDDLLKRYENGEFYSADKIEMPDSLKCYTLKNHRTVYGGGGIMPDLFEPLDTTANSKYYRDIVAKGLINRFCIEYVDDNRADLKLLYPTEKQFIDKFEVKPQMLSDLTDLATKEGIEFNEDDFERSHNLMAVILKALIGRDLFESATYYKITQPALNPTYQRALELMNDNKQFNQLLNPKQ